MMLFFICFPFNQKQQQKEKAAFTRYNTVLGPSVYKGRISALSTKFSLKVTKSDAVYCGMCEVTGKIKKSLCALPAFFWFTF